jgi:hypothetical protein
MERDTLPKLRQQLRGKLSELDRLLEAAFDREPLFPGSLHVSAHRCGKPKCRCSTKGELHEALRLQIRFQGGIANRCLSKEEADFWRPRTEAYRRMRGAERAFRKWQKEVLELLDAIERARRSGEGLSEEDAKRPLR